MASAVSVRMVGRGLRASGRAAQCGDFQRLGQDRVVDGSPVAAVGGHGACRPDVAEERRLRDVVRLDSQTLPYEEAEKLAANGPVTYVDFLGREELTATVHRMLGESLAYSVLFGATDWSAGASTPPPARKPVVGPQPQLLIVPSYLVERLKINRQLLPAMLQDMRSFYGYSRKYVSIDRGSGLEAIAQGWAKLTAGSVRPDKGMVFCFLSMLAQY